MKLKKPLYILSMMLMIVLSGQAHADDECGKYGGNRILLPDTDAQFLKSAIAVIKNKKRKELLAISGRNLQFMRRFLTGGADARGGNLWEELKPDQIDEELNIHVRGQEPLSDLQFIHPSIDGTGVFIDRKICDGVRKCAVVPVWQELEYLIEGVLECNKNQNAVFVFSDGILLTDMEILESLGLPNGGALFFSRTPAGYKLSVVISFQ